MSATAKTAPARKPARRSLDVAGRYRAFLPAALEILETTAATPGHSRRRANCG